MIIWNNKSLAEKMRFLKDHAMSHSERYYHPELGFNYRMTNVEAALGVAQLERVDSFLKRKREIAHNYSKLLKDVPSVDVQPEADWAKNSYWMYSIVLNKNAKVKRSALMEKLKKLNVDTRPFFIANHLFPYFEKMKKAEKFPIALYLSENGINLPSSVLLKDKEITFISQAIREILQ